MPNACLFLYKVPNLIVMCNAALLPASAASAAAAHEELSFIMIKPDGVHRGLIADIIKRFEQKGYKLVGVKLLVPTKVSTHTRQRENV